MRFVLPQLYDIRHRTTSGDLDMDRMLRCPPVVNLREERMRALDRAAARYRFSERRVFSGMQGIVSQTIPRVPPLSSDAWLPDPRETIAVPVPLVAEDEAALLRQTPRRRETHLARSFIAALLVAAMIVPAFSFAGSVMTLRRTMLLSAAEALRDIEAAASAMAAMDTGTAADAFGRAGTTFREARERLSFVGFGILSLIADLPISAQLTSGRALLSAGEELASAGGELSQAFRSVRLFSAESVIAALTFTGKSNGEPPPGDDFAGSLSRAAAHLDRAAEALSRVDIEAVPEQYRQRVVQLTGAIPALRGTVAAIKNYGEAISGILGMNGPRRYLVLLENASELRPTGGFIGNIAIVTVSQGSITKLRIEDTYLFDGQLVRYTVPPKPIQHISRAWSLHDANWYRNFPDSAQIAADFFEETGSATVDGVIAVTSRAVERLLAVVGPVEGADGIVVDAATFTDTLNALGASQKPGETTQVRAVASLLPALLSRIGAGTTDGERVMAAMNESIAAGDFQVWMRDEREEALIRRLGMSGEIPKTAGDVLAVVHGNINGYKTDRVIEETVEHAVAIAADGSMTDTVTITRRHRGNERNEPFYRQVNKNYLRLLVPKGSSFLAATGVTCDSSQNSFDYVAGGYRVDPRVEHAEASARWEGCVEIAEEGGMTSFGAWVFVSPGETVTVRFLYRLPFRIAGAVGSYRLSLVKQPGWEPNVSVRIAVDPAWRIAWHEEALMEQPDGTFYAGPQPLRAHEFFGMVLSRQ